MIDGGAREQEGKWATMGRANMRCGKQFVQDDAIVVVTVVVIVVPLVVLRYRLYWK